MLKKMITTTGVEWHARQVTITQTQVVFQRVGSMAIMDSIPLLEITEVSQSSDSAFVQSLPRLPMRTASMPSGEAPGAAALMGSQRGSKKFSKGQMSRANTAVKVSKGASTMMQKMDSGNESFRGRGADVDTSFAIQIFTQPDGSNSGRAYRLVSADHTGGARVIIS